MASVPLTLDDVREGVSNDQFVAWPVEWEACLLLGHVSADEAQTRMPDGYVVAAETLHHTYVTWNKHEQGCVEPEVGEDLGKGFIVPPDDVPDCACGEELWWTHQASLGTVDASAVTVIHADWMPDYVDPATAATIPKPAVPESAHAFRDAAIHAGWTISEEWIPPGQQHWRWDSSSWADEHDRQGLILCAHHPSSDSECINVTWVTRPTGVLDTCMLTATHIPPGKGRRRDEWLELLISWWRDPSNSPHDWDSLDAYTTRRDNPDQHSA